TFDFASPDTTTPQRYQTTVPQQALFLLNSPFVLEQAQSVVHRLGAGDVGERISRLYQTAYGRRPNDDEIRLGERFLRAAGSDANQDIWLRYAQVLLLANEFAYVD